MRWNSVSWRRGSLNPEPPQVMGSKQNVTLRVQCQASGMSEVASILRDWVGVCPGSASTSVLIVLVPDALVAACPCRFALWEPNGEP
jgi:hypothetical protein